MSTSELKRESTSSRSSMHARSQIRSRSKIMSASQSRLRSQSKNRFGDDDDVDQWVQKDPVPPPDQLQLSEQELKQEFTRIIKANNPYAPHNIVRFNFKDGEYKQNQTVDHTAFLFSMDGNLLHIESDEAKRQLARQPLPTKRESKKSMVDSGTTTAASPAKKADAKKATTSTGAGDDDEDEGVVEDTKKPLRNQFNFSERASQTANYSLKERAMQTEPASRVVYSANVTQWQIFDAYVAHLDKQSAKDKTKKPSKPVATGIGKDSTFGDERSEDNTSPWSGAAKVVSLTDVKKLERMVNQNTFDEVLQDFKFWDDPSDEFKPAQGSLLPLWKFASDTMKKKTVTALAWSPQYMDQFVVGFGSYDYSVQSGGGVSVFSLKNPSAPEFNFATEAGVMCVDVNPEDVSLVAVGFYDGSVAVYQLSYGADSAKPLYQSSASSGKHADPVWQVKWQPTGEGESPSFASVSSDGIVYIWSLVRNEIQRSELTRLNAVEKSNEEKVFSLNSGTCFAFKKADHAFLVGTEEGLIRKCTKAFSSKYLATYQAHSMAVYAVQWNPFHDQVFISCGGDWTVKIWDQKLDKPSFVFDLGDSVADVAWAPFSSTTFAALTQDTVFVFDLTVNKYEAVCTQPLVKKNKLTHIAFNPIHPVLLVGDDRGNVQCLKLSPNLRKIMRDKKVTPEMQIATLTKAMDSMIDGPPAAQ